MVILYIYIYIYRASKKMGAQNQSARLIETQIETLLFVLYYLTVFIIQRRPPKKCSEEYAENIGLLCHRCFDYNLQKNFRTNILENGTGQILLIVFLIVGLWLKFQMVIVD